MSRSARDAEPTATHLDDVDRALLRELTHDGRASYAELAKRIGLSEAALRARVIRLLSGDVIRVGALVNPLVLGIGVIASATIATDGDSVAVTRRLAAFSETTFLAVCAGPFDIAAELRCRSDEHLLDTLDRIRAVDGVHEVETTTYLHIELEYGLGPVGPDADLGLDAVDRRLLRELQLDGRASYARLAPLVGLSQGAVRRRVERLVRSNAVAVVGIANPAALGLGLTGGASLKVSGSARQVAREIATLPEATFVAVVTGRYDVLAVLNASGDLHLVELLDRLRGIPGVRGLTSYTMLTIEKEDYFGAGQLVEVA